MAHASCTPNRVCQACADYGVEHGYTFTARLSEPFNPFTLEDTCDADD